MFACSGEGKGFGVHGLGEGQGRGPSVTLLHWLSFDTLNVHLKCAQAVIAGLLLSYHTLNVHFNCVQAVIAGLLLFIGICCQFWSGLNVNDVPLSKLCDSYRYAV